MLNKYNPQDYQTTTRMVLRNKTDPGLVRSFNCEVGKHGWVHARSIYLQELRYEFERRGWNYSVITNSSGGLILADGYQVYLKGLELLLVDPNISVLGGEVRGGEILLTEQAGTDRDQWFRNFSNKELIGRYKREQKRGLQSNFIQSAYIKDLDAEFRRRFGNSPIRIDDGVIQMKKSWTSSVSSVPNLVFRLTAEGSLLLLFCWLVLAIVVGYDLLRIDVWIGGVFVLTAILMSLTVVGIYLALARLKMIGGVFAGVLSVSVWYGSLLFLVMEASEREEVATQDSQDYTQILVSVAIASLIGLYVYFRDSKMRYSI